MNEHFLKLATNNFYADLNSLRNFFMLGMQEPQAFNIDNIEKKDTAISNYGSESNTINIKGMMVRESSWLTELGYATSTEQVINDIKDTIAEGKKVKLVIDSGGGLVSGTSNLADLIYENRDQIEAYATGVVASAAMWVFSAAGKRYAESTTVMGSIGVVSSVFDDEEYWKAHGIIWKEIVSENAKNKRPDVKTKEGQKEVQRYLTSLETVFIDTVARNLNISRENIISEFHEGGLITGYDAIELEVIDALLTHSNTVATMPSELSAEKIVKNPNIGDVVMDITQKDLDAVQAQLDEANASVTALSAEKTEHEGIVAKITSELEATKVELAEVSSKLGNVDAIVGMAFEHNVSKDVAMEMVKAGSVESAALVVLNAKQSTGATTVNADIEDTADVEAKEEEAELQAAIEYAKRLSVNKK